MVRETKEYQDMSIGKMFWLTWNDPETDEEALAYWQKLVDTGYAWQLNGWYGRQAASMIEAGLIEA